MSQSMIIVPGLDDEMTANVAEAARKLGFEPLVFDGESGPSLQSLMDDFASYEKARLALVLLADDEVGTLRPEFPKNVRLRPTPRVSFAAGFLLGRMGASKVLFIFTPRQNFEFPFDAERMPGIGYDEKGRWHFDLLKELKTRGIAVDANQLI